MSRPKLLLLTEHFPYGTSEPYLETELPYLASAFEVQVLPTSVFAPEFGKRRPLPDDVVVADLNSKRLSYSLAGWIGLFLRKPKLLWQALQLVFQERTNMPRSLWALRRLLRFSAQAVLVADEILESSALREVDLFYSYWLFSNALSIALCKRSGQKGHFVARAHRGDLYHCPSQREYQPLRHQTIGSLDRVFCVSEHGLRYLNQHFPGHDDRVEVSRLGVRAAPNRSRAGDGQAFHIASCSHLGPVKRIELLMDALSSLDFPLVWTHLGGGGQESHIRQIAKELPTNVTWRITGQISNQAVLNFFASQPVDLFVNVSRSEGLPVSIMEALSFGIPVLATDVGGTSELVCDKNGRLLSAEVEADDVARAIDEWNALPMGEKEVRREQAWRSWSAAADAHRQYGKFTESLLTLCSQNRQLADQRHLT